MYSRAYVLMLVPVEQIIVVLGRVLLPVLSRQLGSISDMRSTYVRALRLSSAVMIPTGVGLACLAVPVVSVLFGAKWHGMSEILAILAVTTPVQVVVVTCGPIYQAFGATRAWSRRAAVTAVATMIALCTGAFFGAIGVAVGFAVSSFATAPYAVRLPWQMIGLSARNGIKTVRAELFASALMACWLVGFGHVAHAWGGVAWLASGVISGAAVYVTALAVIEPAVITELKRAITKHSS
jgi:PST family polysaccharide transporter